MAQQTINIGSAVNDGTGDPLRTAFTKSNANFTELYAAGSGTATPVSPQGRLTLQTATPVMTTTQSAKTTIFYALYVGNQVPVYDGTNMVMTAFTELSNITTASSVNNAGPAAVAANSNYDLFVWNNAGTVRLTRGPAWTNDTTRSAGTALVRTNGLYLNNASITNGPAASRGTYVGTVRSNASSQIDWIYGVSGAPMTAAFFGVWNAYNRVPMSTQFGDTTASWTYGSTTIRQQRGNTTYTVSVINGLNEGSIQVSLHAAMQGASTGDYLMCGIGVDTSAAFTGMVATGVNVASALNNTGVTNQFNYLGFHVFSACERVSDAQSAQQYGNLNSEQVNSIVFRNLM